MCADSIWDSSCGGSSAWGRLEACKGSRRRRSPSSCGCVGTSVTCGTRSACDRRSPPGVRSASSFELLPVAPAHGDGLATGSYGRESDDYGWLAEEARLGKRCGDCNVRPGGYHHPRCDLAQCPRCGGRRMGCARYSNGVERRCPNCRTLLYEVSVAALAPGAFIRVKCWKCKNRYDVL